MVIAWMGFASTGILIARYFKFIFQNRNIFKMQIWFAIHFPLMVSVPIISLVSFLIILSYVNWQWLQVTDSTVMFVHSIFGIFTLGLSFIQV
jgi:hypothetical protein